MRETVEEVVLNDPALAAPGAQAFQSQPGASLKERCDPVFTLNRVSNAELINVRKDARVDRVRRDNVATAEPAIPVQVIEQSCAGSAIREGFLGIEQVSLTSRGLAVRVVSSPELPFDQKRISLQVACGECVLGQAPLQGAGPNSVMIELPAAVAKALRLSAAPEGSRTGGTGEDNDALPLLRSRFSYRLLVADSA
jgi:hypothetical protein